MLPSGFTRRNFLAAGASASVLTNLAGCVAPKDGVELARSIGEKGDVVYVKPSDYGSIDPDSTKTPVQDALSEINSGSEKSGVVWLPAGEISDEGPIRDFARVSIIGTGIGRGLPGEHSTTLTINGSGSDGFVIQDPSDATWANLHNFTLKAHDQSDGRAAIRFNGTYHPRSFNIGHLRFQNWTETSTGVISVESNHWWSSHWSAISFHDVRGSGIYCADQPNQVSIDNLYYDPRSGGGNAIEVENTSPKLLIGALNCDRYATRALYFHDLLDNGYVGIGTSAFEPTQKSSEVEAYYLGGTGCVWLGHARVNGTTVQRVVNLGHESGNNIIFSVDLGGLAAVTNNFIEITSPPVEESWYFGSAGDIRNTVGSSTGLVRALSTAGTGVG